MPMNLGQFELGASGVTILSASGTKLNKATLQKMKFSIQDFFSTYE